MKTQLTYQIERASLQDAEKILKLQKLAYISEAELYNDFSIKPLVQTLDEIKEDFRNQTFLKAMCEEVVVGSVRAHEKEGTCYIGRLIVHPDYQNRGIGSKLLDRIEELFSRCEKYELFTGHKSERNLYLYQKQGYRVSDAKEITNNLKFVYLQKLKG